MGTNTIRLHRVFAAKIERVHKVSVGTEISIVQEGVPDINPPDGCYIDWSESLAQLKQLVEPEIPEG